MIESVAVRYGCKARACGYTTLPSTMGTPYAACPLCGGTWGVRPPTAPGLAPAGPARGRRQDVKDVLTLGLADVEDGDA